MQSTPQTAHQRHRFPTLLEAFVKLHEESGADQSQLHHVLEHSGSVQPDRGDRHGVMSEPKNERLENHDEFMMDWMKFTARTNAAQKSVPMVGACRPTDRRLRHEHTLGGPEEVWREIEHFLGDSFGGVLPSHGPH